MQPQPLPAWLERAFLWLNYPVSHYWLLAGLSLAVVAALAIFASTGGTPRWWQRPSVFSAAVLFALAACRWPTWFVQDELNPDESLLLAGSLTLRHFPIPWKDVDTMTAGPLNIYALTGASLLGLPLNFFGARVFTLLVQAGTLLLTGAALQRLVVAPVARLGVLAPLTFWCLTSHHDFLHYSTELVSIFLLALAGWLLATILSGGTSHMRTAAIRLFLAGAALGLVPFAKLQGVPPALALTAIGLGFCWLERRTAGLGPLGWFVAGGVTAPLFVITLVMASGQLAEAWHAYVLNNLWYVVNAPASTGPLSRLLELVDIVPAFRAFWWGSLACTLLLAVSAWQRTATGSRAQLGIAWLVFGAAIVAVLGPRRTLPHYLEFLVIPLGVLVAIHLQAAGPVHSPRRAGLLAVFLSLTVVPQLVLRMQNHHIYAGQFAHYRYEHSPSQAAYFIRQRAQPGDTLTVWGWHSQLFVETGLPQGTREAQTERQLSPDSAVQGYYLQRYLHDLQQRRPAWFVDAVGPASLGYHDRDRHGHETLPDLAQFIRDHYEFCAEIEYLRIYRRRPVTDP